MTQTNFKPTVLSERRQTIEGYVITILEEA